MRSIRLTDTVRTPLTDVVVGDVIVLNPPADANTNPVFSKVGVVIDATVKGPITTFVFHDAFTGCLFEQKMKRTLPGSKKLRSVNVLRQRVMDCEKLIAEMNRSDARLNFRIRSGLRGYFNDERNVAVVLDSDNKTWTVIKDNLPLGNVDSPTELGYLFSPDGMLSGSKRKDENYWFEYSPEEYQAAA